MPEKLDEVDLKILDLLQRDARLTNQAIAQQVKLTAPSVFERIRKLEQRGVIRGYTANIDPAALGNTLTAFIRVTAAFDSKYDAGVQAIVRDPEVLRDRSVGLTGADIQIAEGICGVPVARLIVDDTDVLRDGAVEAALAKQLFRSFQRLVTIKGQRLLQGDPAVGRGLPIHPIKQGRRPERAPMRIRVAEPRDGIEVLARRVALVSIEPVARIEGVKLEHQAVARHLCHD